MQRRIFINRRNTHQADDRQAHPVAAFFYEFIRIQRQNTRLLPLFTSIDLNENIGAAIQPFHFLSEGPRQLFSIEGLDNIKQGNCISSLVSLQRANQMDNRVGVFLP